jgi:hypothetical protein
LAKRIALGAYPGCHGTDMNNNYPYTLDIFLYLVVGLMIYLFGLDEPWYMILLNFGVCMVFIEMVISVVWVSIERRNAVRLMLEGENGGIVPLGGVHA